MAQTLATRIGSTDLSLVEDDITRFPADVIVNAANRALRGGGGVDGAIHARGGPTILAELREHYPNGVATGGAVITRAGNLPAKHVVHAVGPAWSGGRTGEPGLLAAAYRSSLELTAQARARSVAFPAISCGIYRYPLDHAASVALDTVHDWLLAHPQSGLERITFVLRGDDTIQAFTRALGRLGAASTGAERVGPARG